MVGMMIAVAALYLPCNCYFRLANVFSVIVVVADFVVDDEDDDVEDDDDIYVRIFINGSDSVGT